MDLRTVILAPLTIAGRTVQALDDLAAIADRARREPDPVEEVRERLDRVLDELTALRATAAEVDATGREIVTGGRDLTDTAKTLERDTRQLIDGGQDLTAVAERISADLRTFRAMLPRVFGAIETLEKLEDEVETVAETVEPLQGAAERVGRVTRRLSRSS